MLADEIRAELQNGHAVFESNHTRVEDYGNGLELELRYVQDHTATFYYVMTHYVDSRLLSGVPGPS